MRTVKRGRRSCFVLAKWKPTLEDATTHQLRSDRSVSPSARWSKRIPSIQRASWAPRRCRCIRADVDLDRFSTTQTAGCKQMSRFNRFARGNLILVLLSLVGDAQMFRVDMTIETVELLVQTVEAEEAHFRNCDGLFSLVTVRVTVAVGVLVIVIRRMSILVWKELSACHLASEISSSQISLSRDWKLWRILTLDEAFHFKPKWNSTRRKTIEQNSQLATLEIHQNCFYCSI